MHQTDLSPGPYDQEAKALTTRLRSVAAEAKENLWYLCTVAGPHPDPDPNPRGGGQLPNPKSAILR